MPSRENTVAAIRDALARRPEVLEAYLFGSLARGDAQAHSDADVAV
jgi:predicted nucleotidyltransferase